MSVDEKMSTQGYEVWIIQRRMWQNLRRKMKKKKLCIKRFIGIFKQKRNYYIRIMNKDTRSWLIKYKTSFKRS